MGLRKEGSSAVIPKTQVEEELRTVGNISTGIKSPVKDVEGLSRRDVYMAAQAAMKSTLESPTVAAIAARLDDKDIPALIRQYAELGVDIVLKITNDRG